MRIPQFDASPGEIRIFAVVQILLVAGFLGALFMAFGGLDGTLPVWWVILILLAVPALSAFLCERVWLNALPLHPAEHNLQRRAIRSFAGQTLMKVYYCTVPILVAIVMGFLFPASAGWPILIGGVPSFLVLAFEIWPSLRNTSIAEVMLDSDGAESGLSDAFIG